MMTRIFIFVSVLAILGSLAVVLIAIMSAKRRGQQDNEQKKYRG
jgi:hypothetical protein